MAIQPSASSSSAAAAARRLASSSLLLPQHRKEGMKKTIETVQGNFDAVRTRRANRAMLDQVEVEHYGKPSQLESIAQISTPDGSSLLMQPYDKSCLKAIEKAILNSDIGLTPNNDGEVIRLSIPQLISERRKELLTV